MALPLQAWEVEQLMHVLGQDLTAYEKNHGKISSLSVEAADGLIRSLKKDIKQQEKERKREAKKH